jgi:hypothetical protein
MGFKIWRRDINIWSLAFDIEFKDDESVKDYILELNATYFAKIKYGELEFKYYPKDIGLSKDGSLYYV